MHEDLRIRLQRAQDAYQAQVSQIDTAVRAVVARQPERVDEAREFQAQYACAPTFTPAAALEQPEGDPLPPGATTGEEAKDSGKAEGKQKRGFFGKK